MLRGEEMLFKIDNLSASISDKKILNDYNLKIDKGEVHAIMGPNGSGKSTLSKVIMGAPDYKVLGGSVHFEGENILELEVDERARKGIFLAMQSPIEIDGVSNSDFLRTAISAKNNKNVNLYEFIKKVGNVSEDLKMDDGMIHRSINKGFSGGERKKNEILQMRLLEPKLVILDEIDSGLDVDSLKIVSENIVKYKEENPDVSILIITHYPRILNYIKPDYVHIMTCGKIVKTGDYNLALEIESKGYNDTVEECLTKDNDNE